VRFQATPIPGAFVVTPEPFRDERGSFARVWCRDEFTTHGLNPSLAQINTGFNPKAGTLRGIHFQTAPHAEAKLVCCTRGAAWDVVVDLRPGLPTERHWFAVEMTPGNGKMLYVPEGCGHGYLTLEDDTEVRYHASAPYAPDSATGVRYDDPAFGIAWPRPVTSISDRDRNWPRFTPVSPPA